MTKRLGYLVLVLGLLCVAAPHGYAASLVAHWPFDGDGQDVSGNKNDGTAFGSFTYVSGISGQAVQLDGPGQYLQMANNPGMQLLSGNGFTVAAFVNAADTDQGNILIHGLGCSTWASWFLGVQGGEPDAALHPDSFVFGVRSTGGSAYTGVTGPAVAGEWVYIAATHDGTTLKMFINGQETDSVAAPRPFNSGESLYVGGDPGCSGRSWYAGIVDDVYIFNRALKASQIQELGDGTLPSFLKAEKPEPADGTVGVGAPLLRWSPGETAVLHNVYLGTDPNLTEANLVSARQAFLLYYHIAGLTPGATYYWRVDEIDKDGVTIHTGDVWSFVAQALTAYYPTPVDGDNTVAATPTLIWMAGMGTVQHRVYFGMDADAVAQGAADTDKGLLALADNAYTPGALESLTTYFWRVDELGPAGAIKTGPVWSFTTALVVDDFEGYTDNDDGTRIFDTWIDGYADGSSGSIVGNIQAPFAEQTIVHDANQAMPIDYNNVASPFYSEAKREFAPVADWTAAGVDTLVLYVQGRAINSLAPLYVTLSDSTGKSASVVHPNAKIVSVTKWVEWKIPLADFAGVNLSRVKAIVIGVGDRANPQADGTGRIYIDDIRLAKPSP